MALRIGIVGFGRIGRSLFRMGFDRPGVEFAAICDDAPSESLVYLLNNSTIEGRFRAEAKLERNFLVCGGQRARMLPESEPGHIPWDVLGVDVVIECTAHHRSRANMIKHLQAGAKKVIISTPCIDEAVPTFVRGVNCATITGDEEIFSCGSSSVHALSLMCKVLNDKFGIEKAAMTTVHAYTGDQKLSDTAVGGLRWSRSAAQNIIPNESWAPPVVEELIPALKGKLKGLALNVPVPAGSNIDLVTKLPVEVSAEDVHQAFAEAARGKMAGLMGYTDEPIVSSDVVGDSHSVIFDSSATTVLPGGMAKTLGWFDNGWAYATRMLETALISAERAAGGE